MKRFVLSIMAALLIAHGAAAETRIGVTSELLNVVSSGAELENWSLVPAGTAELSILNRGSRLVRSELLLRFTPTVGTLVTELERLYARAAFGETLVTIGKTRSSWGAGLALNAGDIIFGSSSVDFSLQAPDPRSETWWLTSAEIPLAGFSFLELIVLPGPLDMSPLTSPALALLEEASAGGRMSVAVGTATVQAGYLYRGAEIAGLGETGHHAYLSFEGYVPINWHVSASSRTPVDEWSAEDLTESLTATAGAFDDVSFSADRTLSWQLELLVRPYASFDPAAEDAADGATNGAADYGLFLYPGLSFVPRRGLSLSLSSVLSPVDLSARSSLAASWNIYESLTLLSYVSVAAGESGDVFSTDAPAGVSFALGLRYVY